MDTTSPWQEYLLERDIRNFYYAEAELLDERNFEAWLNLFTEDLRYWMPLARNVQFRHSADEYSREGIDSAWMDEDKQTLRQRVQQLATGIHWAEEPRSRVSHLITNIRIVQAVTEDELRTTCRFLVYRNRMESEVDILVGKRHDTLRRVGDDWKISRREILLDQNVLLSKNLTSFF